MAEDVYAGAYMQKLLEPNADFTLYISKSITLFLNEPEDENLKTAFEYVMGIEKKKGQEKEKIKKEEKEGFIDTRAEQKNEKEKGNKAGNEDGDRNGDIDGDSNDIDKSQIKNDGDISPNFDKSSINKNESEKNEEPIKESAEDTETNKQNLEQELLKKELAIKLSLVKGYHYFHKIGFSISQLQTELASMKEDFLLLDKQANNNFKTLKRCKKKNIIYQEKLKQVKKSRKRAEVYEQLSTEILKLDDVESVKKNQRQQKEIIKKINKKIEKAKQVTAFNDENVFKTMEQINSMIAFSAPLENI